MDRHQHSSSKSESSRRDWDKSENSQQPQHEWTELQSGVNQTLVRSPLAEQSNTESQATQERPDHAVVAEQNSTEPRVADGQQDQAAIANQPSERSSVPSYTADDPSPPYRYNFLGRRRNRSKETKMQRWTRITVPLVIGIVIWMSCILCAHIWVQTHVAYAANETAKLEEIREDDARQVYKACYDGLGSTRFNRTSFEACQKTSQIQVNGTICDGNKLSKDKYPEVCLQSLGEQFRDKSVSQLKARYRNQYLWIMWGFLLGASVASLLGGIWRWVAIQAGIQQMAADATRGAIAA